MDKWQKLKMMINADLSYTVHYSSDKNYEHGTTKRVLGFMEQLEKQEETVGVRIGCLPTHKKVYWLRENVLMPIYWELFKKTLTKLLKTVNL